MTPTLAPKASHPPNSQKENDMNRRGAGRRVVVAVTWMLVIAVAVQLLRTSPAKLLRADDFVAYWAAGRLNLAGKNPYSADQLKTLQDPLDWDEQAPLMMWNPPWTLSLLMPFSLLQYRVARALWLILTLVLVLTCADLSWILYGGPRSLRWIAWVLGVSFMPTLLTLRVGQVGAIVLLGTVGFLCSVKHENWARAGVFVFLTAIKPHVVYLFWLALLLWVIREKRWHLLLGFGLTGLVASAIALIFNSQVVAQYIPTIITGSPLPYATPTIGSILRLLFGIERHWLQFVPSLVGIVWLAFYWHRHRDSWQWLHAMPLLLLVSLVTTFFGWQMDQIALLPVVMQSGVAICRDPRRLVFCPGALIYLAANGLALLLNLTDTDSFWYFWMAPALLVSYLTLSRGASRTRGTLRSRVA